MKFNNLLGFQTIPKELLINEADTVLICCKKAKFPSSCLKSGMLYEVSKTDLCSSKELTPNHLHSLFSDLIFDESSFPSRGVLISDMHIENNQVSFKNEIPEIVVDQSVFLRLEETVIFNIVRREYLHFHIR